MLSAILGGVPRSSETGIVDKGATAQEILEGMGEQVGTGEAATQGGHLSRCRSPGLRPRVAVQCKLPRVTLTLEQAGQPSHSHTSLLLGTGHPGDINSHETCTERHR